MTNYNALFSASLASMIAIVVKTLLLLFTSFLADMASFIKQAYTVVIMLEIMIPQLIISRFLMLVLTVNLDFIALIILLISSAKHSFLVKVSVNLNGSYVMLVIKRSLSSDESMKWLAKFIILSSIFGNLVSVWMNSTPFKMMLMRRMSSFLKMLLCLSKMMAVSLL